MGLAAFARKAIREPFNALQLHDPNPLAAPLQIPAGPAALKHGSGSKLSTPDKVPLATTKRARSK